MTGGELGDVFEALHEDVLPEPELGVAKELQEPEAGVNAALPISRYMPGIKTSPDEEHSTQAGHGK